MRKPRKQSQAPVPLLDNVAALPQPAGILLKVRVNQALVDRVKPLLEERGLTLDQAVGLYLRGMVNASERARALRLQDTMPFGKYRGELVETIARAQPDYLLFLLSVSDTLRLDPEVYAVLEQLTVNKEKK